MALHNNVRIALKDATPTQLLASIRWYRDALVRYKEWAAKGTPCSGGIASCTNNLALCEAEYANRIGKPVKNKR